MKRPRIVLADDHSLVLEGLHKLLEDEYDIVGMAEDGRTLLTVAQQHNPDVVVLDISMPQLNGLDAARQLHKLLPTCKIIFLTMHADPTYAKEAFQAGASAFLLKRSAASELMSGHSRGLEGSVLCHSSNYEGGVVASLWRVGTIVEEGKSFDFAPARSVATGGRRQVGERNFGHSQCFQ